MKLNSKNFAPNLKRILKERKLFQSNLAEMTGCTRAAINQVCQGHRCPHANTIIAIMEALDVSFEQLFMEPTHA